MGAKPTAASLIQSMQDRLAAPASVDESTRAREFPLGPTRIHRQRAAEQRRHNARVRQLIRAENADSLIRAFPEADGDSTHALIPGDFEFCDILPRMVAWIGPPVAVHLATLSLSEANVKALHTLATAHKACAFTLALSYFFQTTNKKIFRALETRLVPLPNFRLAIGRLHTKIILFHAPADRKNRARFLALETSANLRSSKNLEQVTVFQCPALYGFHADWLTEFHHRAETGENDHLVSFTGPEARARAV